MSSSDYRLHTLPNGLRVAYLKTPAALLAHCGFVIHAGSRNDGNFPGIAHCLEHMLFKGTQKRKTIHVLNHLEVVGGELNAFTTKEITSIYATVQKKHFKRAADILFDITFNSSFPENELLKEKKVIKDEINMYLDTPEENIYDEFQEKIYNQHPLAHNILGTAETVDTITRQDIIHFVQKHYQFNNLVFVVVGNLPFERVIKIAEELSEKGSFATTISPNHHEIFSSISNYSESALIQPDHTNIDFQYCPFRDTKKSDFGQSYGIMGLPTYPESHPNKFALLLLNNLLGGPGMNSRLSLAIREKYGYTYHIESGYQAFQDSGLFHCYLSCEEKYLKKSIELIEKELIKLKSNKLGKVQLSQAKNQFIGQLTIANESKSGLMLHIGKGIVKSGKANSIKETIERINQISAIDLLETANQVFDLDAFSHLYYVPDK
jgi:predicted Zn-dependent peptidase